MVMILSSWLVQVARLLEVVMVVTLYSNSSVGGFKLLGVYHGYDTVHSNSAVITVMTLYTPIVQLLRL